MALPKVTVRSLQAADIPLIIAYWETATEADFMAMGIDLDDLAVLDDLPQRLQRQLARPPERRGVEVLLGLADGQPFGHCYVNAIRFGIDACLHLHVWQADQRRLGLGTAMVAAAIPHFFDTLNLQQLICEPAASNPAPNRTLERLGFAFERCYETVPAGWNFRLPVNRWVLQRAGLRR